jgi:predicted alpha/beta hydrolase
VAGPGARRGVVLVTHAMMASGAYLVRFAACLAAQGHETFVLDFRGHGASKPPRAGADDWCFDDYVERDVPAAIAEVARVTGITTEQIGYVGHSLGGLAGTAAFATGAAPAPRRLVLVAVNVWTQLRGHTDRRVVAAAFSGLTRVVGRVPARAFRVGTEDEPRSYVAQFRQWTRGRWCGRDGRDYEALSARVTTPTLVVVGDGDWMCRPVDARQFAGRLGTAARIRAVGRLRGDAFDPDHFRLLTDARLENVWREIGDFLS